MSYRTNISSGAQWEDLAGYSRAVKIGSTVEVSGTAPAVVDGQVFGKGDPYMQAINCLEIVEEALQKAGATLQDVVRTRMYVTDISKWESFARAHSEYFGLIKPATTMVEVRKLIHRDMLIEIEATAIISSSEL